MLEHLRAANEVTTTKISGLTQFQQVTTKDLNKVEKSKRLAKYNQWKREELAKAQKVESEPKLTSSQYYGTGAILAVVVLGVFGYYVYQSKKGDATKVTLVH